MNGFRITKRHQSRAVFGLAATVLICFNSTCQTSKQQVSDVPEPLLTYAQLAKRYNQRFNRLKKLRASVTIAYHHTDEEGRHTEQGDGQLAIELPDRLSLKVSHSLKGLLLWAGSDEGRYWMFDFSQKDQEAVYYGRHDKFGKGRSLDLKMPLHPRQVTAMLGLVPLPSLEGDERPVVKRVKQAYVVEPPRHGTRIWIDTKRYEPVRVEVFGENGKILVTAAHEKTQPVQLEGFPPDGCTRVSSRISISRNGKDEQLRLTLSQMRDTDIKPIWFDLDQLMKKAFNKRIPLDRRINLDSPRQVVRRWIRRAPARYREVCAGPPAVRNAYPL